MVDFTCEAISSCPFSVFFCFCLRRLYVCRNLPISSRIFNLLAYNFYGNLIILSTVFCYFSQSWLIYSPNYSLTLYTSSHMGWFSILQHMLSLYSWSSVNLKCPPSTWFIQIVYIFNSTSSVKPFRSTYLELIHVFL